jgi:hypothetical protein
MGVRVRGGERQPPVAQPALHHGDLVALRDLHALRHHPHVVAGGAGGHQRRHLQRLLVVGDHPPHEADVRLVRRLPLCRRRCRAQGGQERQHTGPAHPSGRDERPNGDAAEQ